MRQTKSIMITTAVVALVICASISFSDASPAMSKHGVKAKHKHTLVKHKVRSKHPAAVAQAFAKPNAEEERGATAANDSLWFLRHRDPATGKIPDGLAASWYKADHELLTNSHDGILSGTIGDPIDTVACLGPFNHGGRTRALLVSATDRSNHTFFAGGASGGLWKSTNAGSNWTPINDTAADLSVSCITQSPFNPNNIYYGTGATGSPIIGGLYGGAGVFKSTDGGNTFQQLSATSGLLSSWDIECDKSDSLTVYYGDAGLLRTTDGGTTWNVAPGTNGAVCDILTFSSGKVLIAKQDSGLYYATTGKTGSFTQITSTAFPTGFSRIKLAQCKNFPNVIYAAFGNLFGVPGLAGICKSSDAGVTWDTIPNPAYLGLLGTTQGDYNMMLGVRADDTNSVVCGLQSAAYTTNGGASWYDLGSLIHHDYHGYATLSTSDSVLFGTDGGIYIGHWAHSISWWDSLQLDCTPINTNYATVQFYGGGFAGSGRRCIAGPQDLPTYRIRDTAYGLFSGGDAAYAYISQQDSNIGYYTNWFGNMYKVTNLFGTPVTTTITSSALTGEGINFYNFFQSNYADELQLYARSNKGIWRTIDSGHSWTRLNTPVGTGDIPGIDYIGCTAASNPSVYFDGFDGSSHHFYRIDNAATFTPGTPVNLSASLPNTSYYMGEISPYPTNPSTLYIGFTSDGSTYPHAYKVLNANTSTPTWVNISGNLPSTLGINQIQCDPYDTLNLFAATDYGLYYSFDKGGHWTKEPRVPNTIISEMQLRKSDDKLFLFSYGRGVWYCSIKMSGNPFSVEQASVAPTLAAPQLQFSLYPNPAMEKLTISPQQTLSSSARIAIYSSDGRMISESAWNPTGEVNIGSLPGGAYFLQITDGNLVAKNKFIKQ